MASFFSKYPKIIIDNKVVTDLIARVALREKYSDKLSIFYPYELQEGDTPEIIAAKYYEDPERHWIVMMANDIINPFFDFVLDYQTFEKYIMQKYADQANSALLWKNGNWRGAWNGTEYFEINGVLYEESEMHVTYSEDGSIEYIYDPVTNTTYTISENSPQDIDIFTKYYVNDIVTYDNVAYICTQEHDATPHNFAKDLKLNRWKGIYDGVTWKDTWQNNTEYEINDVVKHGNSIYFCLDSHTSNTVSNITYSNTVYWKTYTNGLEYALVTTYGYRAIITVTDNTTNKTSVDKIFIDKKAYIGEYNDDAFNYANEPVQSENIVLTKDKERISIYDYESEINENKRQIKLIRREYVPQLEKELKILMETYYG